jgi:hypothetical protein
MECCEFFNVDILDTFFVSNKFQIMPSFVCESCNDIVKKPAVKKHRFQCDAAAFSCIDCNRTFVGPDVDAHTACISEAEKYQGALFTPKKRQIANALPTSEVVVATSLTKIGGDNGVDDGNGVNHTGADKNGADSNANSKRSKSDSTRHVHDKPSHVQHHDNDNDNDNDDNHDDSPSSNFASLLDQMQDFKWKKSISAILKSHHGQLPLDQLSNEIVASFHAAFADRLSALVEAKVRSSKKLKLVTEKDGRVIVTANKD